jgi:uncharacterized protein (DUF433 family)
VPEVVAAYANLTAEDVRAAIAFAAQLLKEEEFVAVGKLHS